MFIFYAEGALLVHNEENSFRWRMGDDVFLRVESTSLSLPFSRDKSATAAHAQPRGTARGQQAAFICARGESLNHNSRSRAIYSRKNNKGGA